MQLTPVIAVHLTLALGALALGPVALRARKGSRLHRGLGYAWVTLMAGTALTSIFIRDRALPNLAGYTPIHLLTVLTLVFLVIGIRHIAHGRVQAHRATMQRLYFGACIGAGLFTLLPNRLLGQFVWHQTLGLI